MYEAISHKIRVSVTPYYQEDDSDPDRSRYFWAYQVEIENTGRSPVQLTERHWKISDARGHVEEVRGAGVVGEQPVLQPGDVFEYTSGCPLTTPSGIMVGTYTMVGADGEPFKVDIPAFSLDLPDASPVLN